VNEGVEVRLYTFLTSTLHGGQWSALHIGCITSRERALPYPLNIRLGGPQSQCGHGSEEKNLCLCQETKIMHKLMSSGL